MSIFKKKIPGFTLIEMLIVLSIIVILGAIGTGGLLEFRETMLIKENIEIIKQDVILAQQKAMLLEKKAGENWIFGIGIDFSLLDNEGKYFMVKWCSPFQDFEDGELVTRSSLLAKDPDTDVGNVVPDFDDGTFKSGAVPTNIAGTSSLFCTNPYKCDGLSSSCLAAIEGQDSNKLHDVGEISLLDNVNGEEVRVIIFEAVTGKAFLYNDEYLPINYDLNGSYKAPELRVPLDILITRNRNPRFDLLSLYDSSGIMVHHVYNSDNPFEDALPPTPSPAEYIKVGDQHYKRFTVADDIESYRDY